MGAPASIHTARAASLGPSRSWGGPRGGVEETGQGIYGCERASLRLGSGDMRINDITGDIYEYPLARILNSGRDCLFNIFLFLFLLFSRLFVVLT